MINLLMISAAALCVALPALSYVERHRLLPFTRTSRGLIARFELPLTWQHVDQRELSRLTGKPIEWLEENVVKLWSSFEGEEFILADRIFAGEPEPRFHQLWSRSKPSHEWIDWGEFDQFPSSWRILMDETRHCAGSALGA